MGSCGNQTVDFSHDTDASTDRPSEKWQFDGEHKSSVRVGAEYQALLPDLTDRSCHKLAWSQDDNKKLVWDPSSNGDNTDIKKSDTWSSEEMERFYKFIMIHGKDFFKVSKDVGTQSVKQCVQFYYTWKKVFPHHYRRCLTGDMTQDPYNTPVNTKEENGNNTQGNTKQKNPHKTRGNTKRAAKAAAQIVAETTALMAAEIAAISRTHSRMTNTAQPLGWKQELVGMSDSSSLIPGKAETVEPLNYQLIPGGVDSIYQTIPADALQNMLSGSYPDSDFTSSPTRSMLPDPLLVPGSDITSSYTLSQTRLPDPLLVPDWDITCSYTPLQTLLPDPLLVPDKDIMSSYTPSQTLLPDPLLVTDRDIMSSYRPSQTLLPVPLLVPDRDIMSSYTPSCVSQTMLAGQTFSCKFEDCQMRYSSRQALQSHMRKHKQKLQSNPHPPAQALMNNQHGEEIFPCQLCDKVFAKVKSRSAHMKVHKMAAMTQSENTSLEMTVTVDRPKSARQCVRLAMKNRFKMCLCCVTSLQT